jgi:hypothetical protein
MMRVNGVTPYADIPPIVCEAIATTQDRRFFSHDGVDDLSVPRLIGKVRVGTWRPRRATGTRRTVGWARRFPQRARYLSRVAVSSCTPDCQPHAYTD